MTANTNNNILIVDDVDVNVTLLSMLIKKMGFSVITAANGCEAIEKIEQYEPLIMLLDIMMPKMDGFEVLDHLNSNQKIHELPVIIISALGSQEHIVKGLKLGAHDYLTKPFNETILKARLNNALSHKLYLDDQKNLAHQLQTNIQHLKEKDQSKTVLNSLIVHDLNNPLSSIKGFSKLIQKKSNESNVVKHIECILRASNQMERLIQGMLDVTKMEQNSFHVHYEHVMIKQLFEELLEEFEPMTVGFKEIIIDCDDSLKVQADRGLLRRIIENLIANALKHNKKIKTIELKAFLKDDQITIQVIDDGAGIPQNDQNQIFNKFYQIETHGSTRGMGLGLYFCFLATKRMQGEISVESSPGHGSTFSIKFNQLK